MTNVMPIPFIEMITSEEVPAATASTVEFTPDAGKIRIVEFTAEAAYSQNVAVALVWDLGGVSEQRIWSTKGSSRMPFKKEIITDGIKKLSIVMDNGLIGPVLLSAYAKVEYYA